MKKQKVFQKVAERILKLNKAHTARIAIDGVDCSGKTTFANKIMEILKAYGRNAEIISIDGFHNPAKKRYKMGKDSPEGYYFDSFNNDVIISKVLKPLGPGGSGKYLKSVFDFKTDKEVDIKRVKMPRKSILLFEGVFLMRPELVDFWDLKIWLHADFNITLKRALKRDLYIFKNEETITERYTKRYIPGQKIYMKRANPFKIADIIINNNNPKEPVII